MNNAMCFARHQPYRSLDNVDVFTNFLVEHDFPIIGHRKILLNASGISSKMTYAQLILFAVEEVK